MRKKTKVLFYISILLFTFACSKMKKDDPLIIPPNFCQMPDLKNPAKSEIIDEKNSQEQNVQRLKELLLQSDN